MYKVLLLIFTIIIMVSCNQHKNYLVLVEDADNRQGYLDMKGDTIVPFGKYQMCFTDTIKYFGVVLNKNGQFVGIDQRDKFLFEVFKYDNGPDYFSEGLVRIVKNGKIGYADEQGKIVIEPQYDCAWPFANGKASVSKNCKTEKDGEHEVWMSENWIKIDKNGNVVE